MVLLAAYRSVAASAAEKGVRFRVVIPPEVAVKADPERLQKVFEHLFDNAVRFTPPVERLSDGAPSGGTVTVRVFPRDAGVLVEVEDAGCGLASEVTEHVFTAFYQVEDPLVRSQEGLGVGLAIARGIVDLHGGKMWARSEGIGLGATFSVWLPERSGLVGTSAARDAVPLVHEECVRC